MKVFTGNYSKLFKFLQNRGSFIPLRFCTRSIARRTNETNPANHSIEQIGLYYTISNDDRKKLFSHGGFPKPFEANINTFTETCIMIRNPALEVIDCLKKSNFHSPAIRYVLYGKPGVGKSITLAHIIHYAYLEGFYILHVPWVWDWFRNKRTETAPSSYVEGFVDLPIISASWLKNFQSQNAHLLSGDEDKLIRTSKEYVWNQRETTPAGSPILELVLHGINRIKYSAAVVSAVITELKLCSTAGKCKVFVAIDGVNGFFSNASNVISEDRSKVFPNKVSLVHSFLEAVKQDWKGGAVVVTTDQRCGYLPENKSHFPLYLLTKEGFEHLDPFIPVVVEELTSVELDSMLDYYEDRQWIHRTEGRNELAFLSNHNAGVLMKLCASL